MRSLSLAFPLALLVGVLAGTPALATTDPDPADYRKVVDITFPTDPRATFMDDYDHARGGGRVHAATDLMGEKMWPVYAAVGGTVTWIPGADGGDKPAYGYMIRIKGTDGRTYSYVHLNDDTPGTSDASAGPEHAYAPGLREGSEVKRGQFIGYLGDSGNAKGGSPHLHFEIHDPDVTDPQGGDRINPYESLKAALERGDVSSDQPEASATVSRVAGSDRIGTAVAMSAEVFERADTVVLASGASFPDSVVAGPLAAALDAPVLTNFRDALDGRVAAEIDRLGASKLIVVGGPTAISRSVIDDLVAQTDLDREDIRRLAGGDEMETAALVAAEVRRLTGSRDALLALGSHPEEGKDWPDALTAGFHGARTGQPVLLVTHSALPSSTRAALADVESVTIIGGTAAVSTDIADEVEGLVDSVTRLSGRDRFATAGAVADDLISSGAADPARLWAATGGGFADALATAGALGQTGDAFILVDGRGGRGDGSLDEWFIEHGPAVERATVIGGSAAVSEAAAARLAQRIGGAPQG